MVGVMATSSLFTIEQIELIRRLRKTGITKKQVVEAFEQLEKLDGELGHNATIADSPVHCSSGTTSNSGSSYEALTVTMAQMSSQNQGNNSANTINKVENTNASKTANSSCPVLNSGFINACSSDISTPPQFGPRYSDSSMPNNACNDSTMEVSNVQSSPTMLTTPTSRLPSGLTLIPLSTNGSSSETTIPKISDVSLQCRLNPVDFYQEEPVMELDEFKKKGEEAILNEIRNFVMRYNIKQTVIAEMTKLCQAYVSRFFRGDTADMSEKTKNVFYTWYLTCRNNLWKLAQLCPSSGVKHMVSETGDLIPLKRERFTFKGAHLNVLEKYYKKDPYPDSHTREVIVDECNRAMERQDRCLSDREKVSLPIINNWFNNRRKEAKKQMRQHNAVSGNGLAQMAQGSLVGSNPQLVSQLSLPLTCPMSSGNWIPAITSVAALSSFSQASSSHNNSNHSSSEDDEDSSGNYDGSDNSMVITKEEKSPEYIVKTET